MAPCDVWIAIEARAESMQEQWEIARAIAFSNAQFSFGKCKAKTAKAFWKFPWDKKATASNAAQIMQEHALMKAKREAYNKQNNGSS